MNTGVEVALLVPVAYLLGTFPSADARRRAARASTSPPRARATPGASNTFRLLGWKAGALVFALDVAKGALAAGVGLAVDGHRGAYVLGVAADHRAHAPGDPAGSRAAAAWPPAPA